VRAGPAGCPSVCRPAPETPRECPGRAARRPGT
jgi:hypothetical protein